jgi:hypothetical protein
VLEYNTIRDFMVSFLGRIVVCKEPYSSNPNPESFIPESSLDPTY